MPSVERAAVVTHGRTRDVGDAFARLQKAAEQAGVELSFDSEEAEKHGVAATDGDGAADIAIVLGGDGTMLRALTRFLGTGVPVFGVNFGSVGFLTAISGDALEVGIARVLAGDFRVTELPTLAVELDGQRGCALNDCVVTSSTPGRMIQLGYAIGGEDLGTQPCDGLICATPSGSTAYNLSNGGPVLVWGLEAMVITFVAPHSLHTRPLVVGPETELVVTNRSPALAATVLVDGHPVGELPPGERVVAQLGTQQSLLGTLPERGFFQRYSDVFGAG
jgi:NAD+ kinase